MLYKRLWFHSLAMQSRSSVVDRPLFPSNSIANANTEQMQRTISKFTREHPSHPVVLSLAGIASRSRDSKVVAIEKMKQTMKAIVNHHLSTISKQDKADCTADLLFNGHLFTKPSMDKVARKITQCYNSHEFSAIALLKTIDCHVGALNDTGVTQYARIGNPKRGSALLTKRHQVSKVRKFCDRYIAELFSVHHDQTTRYGEYIHVEYESQLRFLIKQYGLTDIAHTVGIQIAITGDGAALTSSTRKAGQTCLGIKMVDPRCTDPITKELCFITTIQNEDNIDIEAFDGVQSANHCFPSAIVSSPESRNLVTGHFRDFFDFFNRLRTHGLSRRGDEPSFKPFDIVCPADLSFQQKITGLGGACKNARFFCTCCESNSLINLDLFYRTEDPGEFCQFCVSNDVTSCCHRPVNDAAEIERKKQWLIETLVNDNRRRHNNESMTLFDCLPDGECKCFVGYEVKNKKRTKKYEKVNLRDTVDDVGNLLMHISVYLDQIQHSVELVARAPLVVLDPYAATKSVDPSNIDYVVSDNNSLNLAFKTNVLRELSRRRIAFDSTAQLEQLRDILRGQLLLRYKIERYKNALHCHHVATLNRAVVGPDQTACCVLHFHQRTIEKIVSELLTRGLNECNGPAEIDLFLDEVSRVVNRQIFRRPDLHEEDNSGWKVPMKPDGKQIADITMDDPTCKLFDSGMDYLIDVCLGSHRFGNQYVTDWKECMNGYRLVRAMITSRKTFEYDDVCAFVVTADSFMERYVALTGRDGMTNYFHMLRDGHVAYYLLRYRNLYRLSQQGWENVNSVMKRSFHRGTQRGGCRRKGKLKPVFFRIVRAAMWRMGHMEGLLHHFGYKKNEHFEYGNIFKLPNFENVMSEEIKEYAGSILQFGRDWLDDLVDSIDDTELEIAEA